MFSDLNIGADQQVQDLEDIEMGDVGQAQQLRENSHFVMEVHNDWRGGCTDKLLGAMSVVSMSVGAVMMGVGHIMMNGGEQSVQHGIFLIKDVMRQQREPTEPTLDTNAIAEQAAKNALGDLDQLTDFQTKCHIVKEGSGAEGSGFSDIDSSQCMKSFCPDLSSAYKPLAAKVETGIRANMDKLQEQLSEYTSQMEEQRDEIRSATNVFLGLIDNGNRKTVLGAGIMAFGAGCGFVGLGASVEYLRRYLCGGPPRQ